MSEPTPTKLRLLKIDDAGEIDFYFEDSQEPFALIEFIEGTLTRKHLEEIDNAIKDYNLEVDFINHGN